MFLMCQFASVLSRAILCSCFDAECYLTWFNMDWVVLWTLVHAFSWSTFSLLLTQKSQQAKKTCFQHLQSKFFQWVHYIYLLALCYSEYVYHVTLSYLYLWIKMLMLVIIMWKIWLNSSHTLLLHLINMNHHD